MKYETFQQKLDRFKREPIGFLVKSKEIADELAKVFEREGMVGEAGSSPEDIMGRCVQGGKYYEGRPWVSYNYTTDIHELSYGNVGASGDHLEFLDVTLEELESYNAPQTLEDKLALFKAGTHVLHTPTQEIYDKLMVELEKRGYAWCYTDDLPTEHNGYSGGPYVTKFFVYEHDGIARQSKAYSKEILELTPEDFRSPQVITITSDGYHRVTAESNGVLAEALCNPTDKFSIHKGSHMALKRLLEKMEGKPEATEWFHVGDIVEVVKHDYYFPNDITGIQGVITKKYERACDVKFPVEICNEKTWTFCNSGLKLVRKYNA